jgi:hypothetical protein
MNKLTLLLKNQSQPTLTLRIPPSKQLALKKFPYTISTGLQNNIERLQWGVTFSQVVWLIGC